VADAVYAYETIAHPFVTADTSLRRRARLAVCIPDDPHISDAIPEMKAALARFADAFAMAGHAVMECGEEIGLG
jgi:hypothetical protein